MYNRFQKFLRGISNSNPLHLKNVYAGNHQQDTLNEPSDIYWYLVEAQIKRKRWLFEDQFHL